MKSKKPFCWVIVPGTGKIQQLTSFWKAVAHLANEGKDVMCHMPSKESLGMLESKNVSCDELVVVGLEKWEVDPDVRAVVQWAQKRNVDVRVMNDEVWMEVETSPASMCKKRAVSFS